MSRIKVSENNIRSLVRRILLEADGDPTAAAATAEPELLSVIVANKDINDNPGDRSFFIAGIYASDDADRADNLLDGNDINKRVTPGDNKVVTYRKPAADKVKVVVVSKPSGVTKGYERGAIEGTAEIMTGGPSFRVTLPARATSPSEGEESDAEAMTQGEIDALPRAAGEFVEVMEDPTDPEFTYAVFYKKVPTRAVVVKAPLGDTKGGRAVQSRGRELNMKSYAGAFRTIGGAFVAQAEQEAPKIEEEEPPAAP